MKNKLLVVIVIVVVIGGIGAVIGPKIYRDYFVKKADKSPESKISDNQDTVKVADLAGEWHVGDGSYAGYRVNEVLNGTDVTVTGRTKKVSGNIVVKNKTLESATINLKVADIKTDASKRDDYFRTKALETSKYPYATFVLSQPVKLDKRAATYNVTGTMMIHGVKKMLTIPIKTGYHNQRVQLASSIPVTFKDFNVNAPSLGFVKVEDHGKVEVFLSLTK